MTVAGMSLEEITRKRRAERAQLKLKKAQQQPSDQGQKSVVATPPVTPTTTPALGPSNLESTPSSTQTNPTVPQLISRSSVIDIEENYEHLQLSLEEAFFLVFAIECISVMEAAADLAKGKQKSSARMSIQSCWLRFAEASIVQEPKLLSHLSTPSSYEISASNPFFVRYVAYHHYRSQGWIVKDGLKYGTDFLLYQKGLVFGHSQYAVKVIPFMNGDNVNKESESVSQHCLNFSQTFISPTPGLCSQHQALSWQWLLTLNRVIAQVQKTVILCHVEIPKFATKRQLSHPRTALPLYKVVEIGVKRFIPERNRA
ncbi:tRNA splicing endonuclease subunit sen2 [Haplosporangium sp. Z 27]|nr:tRNA splicing endonuclease subunit sen2 [Haplosporangium sp. Z 27]